MARQPKQKVIEDAEVVEETKMVQVDAEKEKQIIDALMVKTFSYLWGIEHTNAIPKGEFKEMVAALSTLAYQVVIGELEK